MTILKRVETLEAALLQTRDDADYKLVLLEEGESRDEGITRSGLKDWPADRIMAIRFVSAKRKYDVSHLTQTHIGADFPIMAVAL